jgi:hypothetical protein
LSFSQAAHASDMVVSPGAETLAQADTCRQSQGRKQMLFQVTHKHSEETCPGVHSDKFDIGAWWNQVKGTSGIKVLGGYVSPMDHTIYVTVETDDFGALTRAMGPLNALGSGYTTPVVTLDAAIPMAEQGTFRQG